MATKPSALIPAKPHSGCTRRRSPAKPDAGPLTESLRRAAARADSPMIGRWFAALAGVDTAGDSEHRTEGAAAP